MLSRCQPFWAWSVLLHLCSIEVAVLIWSRSQRVNYSDLQRRLFRSSVRNAPPGSTNSNNFQSINMTQSVSSARPHAISVAGLKLPFVHDAAPSRMIQRRFHRGGAGNHRPGAHNTRGLNLEAASVTANAPGTIVIDRNMRTVISAFFMLPCKK